MQRASPFIVGWPLPAPRPGRPCLLTRSAVGTGTKRTECAPPSANALLSNTCRSPYHTVTMLAQLVRHSSTSLA